VSNLSTSRRRAAHARAATPSARANGEDGARERCASNGARDARSRRARARREMIASNERMRDDAFDALTTTR